MRNISTKNTSSSNKEQGGPWLLVVAAASTVAAAGYLWHYLFRRPCRYLSNSDLPPSAASDGITVVRELDVEEERLAIKKAFLAGDDFRYMVSGKDYKTTVDEQQHRTVTFGIIEYMIAICEQYGHLLVCHDKEDGTLLGAVGLIPPYRNQAMFTLHFYRTVLPYGMPTPLSMGKEIAARFEAFMVMEQIHEECTKNRPHWYVQLIGVSDKAQGRGVGTKLMNVAIALAGTMPMYLDCHNDNVPYYERFGFVVEKTITISPKGISDTSTFEMNGMVRGL